MYRKNTASQHIGFGLVNASSGAALTGASVTVKRSLDGGAQGSGGGTVTELGNGQYDYAFSQADTNANIGSYLFTATNAIPVEKTVIFTAADPTDAVRLGLTALPNANAGASGGLPTGDSNAAVKVQAGTGTGQLDFTSGVVKANLAQILGTALTETAGQIAAAFTWFFDRSSPTGHINSLPNAVPTATNGLPTRGSGTGQFNMSSGRVSADVATWRGAIPETLSTGTGLNLVQVDVEGYGTGQDPATLLLDGANGVETGFTLRQALRLILAMAAGKLSISGNTVTIRDVNDSKDRITATTDSNGQRTAVTKDVS